jgi:SAM-dependent methyltransferase
MNQPDPIFRDRDYWIVENTLYTQASFRLRKCARLIDGMAGNRKCSLLDVGCGPAALEPLLKRNVAYYGIDIAIHNPAENLREIDIANQPIAFNDKRFDFVVALGVFEYMGHQQKKKLQEILDILKEDGKLVLSYINFGHYRRQIWPNYNNVQSTAEMMKALSEFFQVERHFPASHHWRQKQPGKHSLPSLQMNMNFNIPVLSSMLAVEYFFICSPRHKAVTASM